MATPETCSVELDPFAPSFDGDLDVVENEEHQLVEAEVRELSAYTFDSDEKTIVGIGGSASSVDSSAAGHFDISDRTLVGIGPAEREEREEREEGCGGERPQRREEGGRAHPAQDRPPRPRPHRRARPSPPRP